MELKSTTQRDEDSDHLDESEEEKAPAKKRKTTKVAEAKQKAKAKAAAKKKKGDGDEDYEDSEDEDDDVYTALSRNMVANAAASPPKPGSFEECARCEIQFTVVRLASYVRLQNVWSDHQSDLSRQSTRWQQTRHPDTCATSVSRRLARTRGLPLQLGNAKPPSTNEMSFISKRRDFQLWCLCAFRQALCCPELGDCPC